MIKSISKTIFTTVILYSCIIVFCYFIVNFLAPVLSQDDVKISYFDMRSAQLIRLSRHTTLARCFFRNSPIFDNELFEVLRSAGILHLVAISGGQVRLVIDVAVRLPLYYFLFWSRYFLKSRQAVATTVRLFNFFEPLLSGLAATVFGLSGSLQRVWFVHYIANNSLFRKQALALSTTYPHISPHFFRRLAAVFFICILFGNPWINLSFLLSAAGSAMASLASAKLHRRDDGILKSFIKRTATTTFLTTLVLTPIVSTHMLSAIFSNILSIPLVDLFLVPLAMCLLFFPLPYQLTKIGMRLFDTGADYFSAIAQFFGSGGTSVVEPWPQWTNAYLGSVVVGVWTIQEVRNMWLRMRIRRLVGQTL